MKLEDTFIVRVRGLSGNGELMCGGLVHIKVNCHRSVGGHRALSPCPNTRETRAPHWDKDGLGKDGGTDAQSFESQGVRTSVGVDIKTNEAIWDQLLFDETLRQDVAFVTTLTDMENTYEHTLLLTRVVLRRGGCASSAASTQRHTWNQRCLTKVIVPCFRFPTRVFDILMYPVMDAIQQLWTRTFGFQCFCFDDLFM